MYIGGGKISEGVGHSGSCSIGPKSTDSLDSLYKGKKAKGNNKSEKIEPPQEAPNANSQETIQSEHTKTKVNDNLDDIALNAGNGAVEPAAIPASEPKRKKRDKKEKKIKAVDATNIGDNVMETEDGKGQGKQPDLKQSETLAGDAAKVNDVVGIQTEEDSKLSKKEKRKRKRDSEMNGKSKVTEETDSPSKKVKADQAQSVDFSDILAEVLKNANPTLTLGQFLLQIKQQAGEFKSDDKDTSNAEQQMLQALAVTSDGKIVAR